jgi:glycosyltransferase involved in cell wall biosynthesis
MTISQNSKDDIVKVLKLSEDKIKVVHLAVEERFMSPDVRDGEIRRKYSLPKEFIFYVGNLSPHKNVRGLIKAYKALPELLREKYKLVIGASKKAEYFADIEKVIREMKLLSEVFFTGFIEEKDLPTVYRMSELFAFPSLYEGFGLPPLEAMASGCPVVSSNTSSLPEVLGDAALLFNPYDIEEVSSAMRKMLEDENLRNMFRQKGLERAKIFTSERMTEKIISFLESIPYL